MEVQMQSAGVLVHAAAAEMNVVVMTNQATKVHQIAVMINAEIN